MGVKAFFLVLVGLFSLRVGYSQTVEHFSHDDSIRLKKFWDDFTDAIGKKSQKNLRKLCHFPFGCNPCVEESDSGRDYIDVDNNNFDKGRYKFFFEPTVLKTLAEHTMPKDLAIFQSAYDESGKVRTGYNFVCISRPDTKKSPGYEIFITVKSFAGIFKVISVWQIP